jgi:hypothetical protein
MVWSDFLIQIEEIATNSSSTTVVPSAFSVLISEKLTKSNYLLWKA